MADIFLYSGEPNPNDIKLSDPTVLRGGVVVYSYTGTGGIIFAGAAAYSEAWAYAGAGGIAFGGDAAVTETWAYAGAGGIVFAGAATYAEAWAYAGAGGIIFGGAAAASYVPGIIVYAYTGSGGITFGGAAHYVGPTAVVIDKSGGYFRRRYHMEVHLEGVEAQLSIGQVSVIAKTSASISGVELQTSVGQVAVDAVALLGLDDLKVAADIGQVHIVASVRTAVVLPFVISGKMGQAEGQVLVRAQVEGRSVTAQIGRASVVIGEDLVEQELDEILFLLEVA